MLNSKTGPESVGNGGNVIAWVILLFGLTVVGALPLIVGGLNLDNLPQSSPLLPLVFAGIVLTAYAPSLAALLVAGLLPRAGDGRALLRQVRTWRVGLAWYVLVLIGPMVLILLADLIYIVLGGAPPQQWLVFPLGFCLYRPFAGGIVG